MRAASGSCAQAEATRLYREALRAAGVDPDAWPVRTGVSPQSYLTLEGRAHRSTGTVAPKEIGQGRGVGIVSHGPRLARRIIPVALREAAITASGGDPLRPPAWAFRIQPVLGLALLHDGWTPRSLTLMDTPTRTGLRQNWDSVRQAMDDGVIDRDGHLDRDRISKGTPVLDATGESITAERIQLHRPDGEEILVTIATGQTVEVHVSMPGSIPRTVQHGIPGSLLRDVIGHPAFARAPERITTAVVQNFTGNQDRTGLKLTLRREWARLDRIPEGTDTAWTDTTRTLADLA